MFGVFGEIGDGSLKLGTFIREGAGLKNENVVALDDPSPATSGLVDVTSRWRPRLDLEVYNE